ncbi:MAG: protein ImuB [Phycisphaerales bacterium]|jgi:protein ImuB
MPEARPVLITEHERSRQVVTHACDRARAVGVRPGMTLGDARAILPPGGARVEERAPRREAATLRALAVWAVRFAPAVAADPPDGLLLDVTGCERMWKGEPRLRALLIEASNALGVRAQAAIAPTFGAAWALARFGNEPTQIVPLGEHRAGLAALPVAALRLDPDTVNDLATLGIERIEHLLALPRSTLPARFGPSVLRRLDQAMGEAFETIDPVRTPEPPRVERVFDGSTDRWEAMELTVRELLRELCARLLQIERGALRLEAQLLRADLSPARLVATLTRPSRDPRHLWSVVRPDLERVNMGFGVEGVTLTAAITARIRHEQAARWSPEAFDTTRAQGELLDTLAAQLGGGRVARAKTQESHVPERAARWASVLDPRRRTDEALPPPADRPTRLFEPPRQAAAIVLAPDGPVLSLSWDGQESRIDRCVGPERIGPEWWVGDRQSRDYFKVQDEHGRWLWAYRESVSRRWRVHGVWA